MRRYLLAVIRQEPGSAWAVCLHDQRNDCLLVLRGGLAKAAAIRTARRLTAKYGPAEVWE